MAAKVKEVYKLLLKSWTRRNILEYLYEKHGLNENTAEYVLTQSLKYLKQDFDKSRNEVLEKTISFYDQIIQEAHAGADLRTAIEAQREKSKILGLYSPEKLQTEIKIRYVEGDEDL